MDLVKDHGGEGDRRSGTIRGGWVTIEEEDRDVAGVGTSGDSRVAKRWIWSKTTEEKVTGDRVPSGVAG